MASITNGVASFDWSPPKAPPNPQGKVFYVDNSGSPSYAGEDRYATVALALAQCVDYRGDIIYVAPNHTETITASDLALDVSGVSIIGLGGYGTRSVWTLSAAGSKIAITGSDMTLENIEILAGYADVATAVTVAAKGVTIRNCFFNEGTALNMLIAIQVGAADNDSDGFVCEDCVFNTPDAANTNGIDFNKDCNDAVIKGCFFYSDYAAASGNGAISQDVGGNVEVLRIRILNNLGYDAATDGVAPFIDLADAGNTGIMAFNLNYSADADAGANVNAAVAEFENYTTNNLANSGTLTPAVE